jgi:hypothetical protein
MGVRTLQSSHAIPPPHTDNPGGRFAAVAVGRADGSDAHSVSEGLSGPIPVEGVRWAEAAESAKRDATRP